MPQITKEQIVERLGASTQVELIPPPDMSALDSFLARWAGNWYNPKAVRLTDFNIQSFAITLAPIPGRPTPAVDLQVAFRHLVTKRMQFSSLPLIFRSFECIGVELSELAVPLRSEE